jgi:hypothetical protein
MANRANAAQAAPRKPLTTRVKAAFSAFATALATGCVHDWQSIMVGPRLDRKGYRPGVKSKAGVLEQCAVCGQRRAHWVRA